MIMGALIEAIVQFLTWVAIAIYVVATWIAVNFARAIIQAIFPHPEFFDRRLL